MIPLISDNDADITQVNSLRLTVGSICNVGSIGFAILIFNLFPNNSFAYFILNAFLSGFLVLVFTVMLILIEEDEMIASININLPDTITVAPNKSNEEIKASDLIGDDYQSNSDLHIDMRRMSTKSNIIVRFEIPPPTPRGRPDSTPRTAPAPVNANAPSIIPLAQPSTINTQQQQQQQSIDDLEAFRSPRRFKIKTWARRLKASEEEIQDEEIDGKVSFRKRTPTTPRVAAAAAHQPQQVQREEQIVASTLQPVQPVPINASATTQPLESARLVNKQYEPVPQTPLIKEESSPSVSSTIAIASLEPSVVNNDSSNSTPAAVTTPVVAVVVAADQDSLGNKESINPAEQPAAEDEDNENDDEDNDEEDGDNANIENPDNSSQQVRVPTPTMVPPIDFNRSSLISLTNSQGYPNDDNVSKVADMLSKQLPGSAEEENEKHRLEEEERRKNQKPTVSELIRTGKIVAVVSLVIDFVIAHVDIWRMSQFRSLVFTTAFYWFQVELSGAVLPIYVKHYLKLKSPQSLPSLDSYFVILLCVLQAGQAVSQIFLALVANHVRIETVYRISLPLLLIVKVLYCFVFEVGASPFAIFGIVAAEGILLGGVFTGMC